MGSHCLRAAWLSLSLLAAVASPRASFAQAPAPAAGDDATARGRAAFLRGIELSHKEQWGDALTAFEEAATARNAPIVGFNIAYCQRALGRYVAARRAIKRVLLDTTGLEPGQIEDSKAYLADFEKLIVRVKVTIDPPTAALTIDGRLLVAEEGSVDTYLGSVGPAGVGASLGKSTFVVLLDPGPHVFRAVRPGHGDALVNRSFRAGDNAALELRLDVMPATVSIRSEPLSAIVRVDKREVGVAPIEFQRPAGTYRVQVIADNYEPYDATLDLAPGQRSDLTAKLNPYKEPITKKWWFWTGAAAIVAGGVVLTYVLTRPTPQPPPYDQGNANWLVQPKGIRW